jgi:hypothetical protein
MMELPAITKSIYGSTSSVFDPELVRMAEEAIARRPELGRPVAAQAQHHAAQQLHQPKKELPVSRIVRVFIADPNESIPIDKRVLHASGEMHTDLTDQELFFEANPAALLAKHNEYRVTVLDKKLTNPQREIKLEPARIRDLKMVVVDVAVF